MNINDPHEEYTITSAEVIEMLQALHSIIYPVASYDVDDVTMLRGIIAGMRQRAVPLHARLADLINLKDCVYPTVEEIDGRL